MNRLLSATLVATILFTPLTTVSAQTAFPDVPDDYIYADAIEYVKEQGIVSGFTDGTFQAEKTITRAEFTKIVVNSIYDDFQKQLCEGEYYLISDGFDKQYVFPDVALDSKIDNEGTPEHGEYMFGDAASKFWREICVAKNNNLIGGYSDGNFYPENPITVGEASKIISNAYKFTDVDSGPEGDVFKPFVDALAERQAIPETILDIEDNLTRGQLAEIIFRLETENTSKDSVHYDDLRWKESFVMLSDAYGDSIHYKTKLPTSLNLHNMSETNVSAENSRFEITFESMIEGENKIFDGISRVDIPSVYEGYSYARVDDGSYTQTKNFDEDCLAYGGEVILPAPCGRDGLWLSRETIWGLNVQCSEKISGGYLYCDRIMENLESFE